jgi:hypothetical protein
MGGSATSESTLPQVCYLEKTRPTITDSYISKYITRYDLNSYAYTFYVELSQKLLY